MVTNDNCLNSVRMHIPSWLRVLAKWLSTQVFKLFANQMTWGCSLIGCLYIPPQMQQSAPQILPLFGSQLVCALMWLDNSRRCLSPNTCWLPLQITSVPYLADWYFQDGNFKWKIVLLWNYPFYKAVTGRKKEKKREKKGAWPGLTRFTN